MNNGLSCSVCQFSFDTSAFLLTHLQNLCKEEFHKSSNFVCPICQLNVQGCSNFVDHLSMHNPVDKTPDDTVSPVIKQHNPCPVQSTDKTLQSG